MSEKEFFTTDDLFGGKRETPEPPVETPEPTDTTAPETPSDPVEPPVTPAAETPADPVETPVTPPAQAPETPATPSFDFSQFGEKFRSPDDVKQVLTQFESISQENESLKGMLSEFQNPFVNDTVAKMNALVKKGIDPGLSYRLAQINTESINQIPDIEVIALKEMMEIPSYISMEQDLKDDLYDRYNTKVPTDEEAEDMTADEIERAKRSAKRNELSLKRDAANARKFLAEATKTSEEGSSDVTATIQKRQQERQQLAEEWSKIAPVLVEKKLRELSVPVGDWNNELMKVHLSEEQIKGFDKEVQQLATERNIPLNEQGLSALYSEAYGKMFLKNLPNIMSLVVKDVKAKAIAEIEAKYANPSYKPGQTSKPDNGGELTKDERIAKQVDKVFGSPRRR